MTANTGRSGANNPTDARPGAPRSSDERSATRRQSDGATGSRLARGAEGGALATLVMTAYRLPVSRSLPPSAEFWSMVVGDDRPETHPVAAIVLHFAYGIGAGVAFAAVARSRESVSDGEREITTPEPGPPSKSGEVSTTVLGLLYGVALSVFGERVVLGRLLGVDPDDRFAFHVGHVLYGIALGSWVGTRTRDR